MYKLKHSLLPFSVQQNTSLHMAEAKIQFALRQIRNSTKAENMESADDYDQASESMDMPMVMPSPPCTASTSTNLPKKKANKRKKTLDIPPSTPVVVTKKPKQKKTMLPPPPPEEGSDSEDETDDVESIDGGNATMDIPDTIPPPPPQTLLPETVSSTEHIVSIILPQNTLPLHLPPK